MRRILVGVTTSLAIWFGSALAAEAQQIVPTGPTFLYAGTDYPYTATITLPCLADFEVQLNVYKGRNLVTPVLSYDLWVYGPTSTTYSYSQPCTFSPPCAIGEKYTFKATLITTNPVASTNAAPVIITVTNPTSYVSPSKCDLALEAIDRDRRHEA